jgi:NSS family neurotransmitter:Na+ symporter
LDQPRDHWTSRIGFVLAASGSAIGLGNLWKFPYITWENRGGAFVLVYLLCIAMIGLPIMMTEILIGRKTQKSAVGALKQAVGPAWGFIGGLGVFTGFVILGYYTVIAGWTLQYFWNCLRWSFLGFSAGASSGDSFTAFAGNGPLQVGLSLGFMTITAFVVHRGISGGIERVSRLLMPVLFGILALLLVSALSLQGAGAALSFIFKPDFSQLRPVGVLEALGHSFFTLSLGMGAMITYGSYLGRRESVVRSSLVVVVLDTVIALVATVIMFSVIFSFDMADAVGKSTAGMLFITLPTLFYENVPFGTVLAPLFYVLVGFAALTSTISLLEVVASYFIDQRSWSRPKATWTCSAGIFLLSTLCGLSFGGWTAVSDFNWIQAKQGLFAHLDHLASNWLLPIGGFFITLAAGWAMTREATESELEGDNTPGWFHYSVWRFCIRFVAPIAVAAIIVAVIAGKDFS